MLPLAPDASLPAPLARIHGWTRSRTWLARFTLVNRVLLFMAFLPTGLVKATGQRFTTMPVETPVGFFFEAMYRTGPYWHFIGVVQVAAAVCLIVPATSTLGALLFFPVILSIALVTYGVGFGGTVYVTSAMLLSSVYLLCWDADRVWRAASHVLGSRPGPPLLTGANGAEKAGWAAGGVAGAALMLVTRGFLPRSWAAPLLVVGGLAVLAVGIGWGAARRGAAGGGRRGAGEPGDGL